MRLGRRALPWLIAAWLVVPTAAFGQDRLARTHYEAGSSYYQQGRYEDALREFEEAHRLSSPARRAVLLYNIGLAHERLGHLTQAIDALRQYVEGAPGAEDVEVVRERMRTLQERLDSTAVALEVSEEGARVVVDGEDRGMSPLADPVRVPPGAHEVRVEKQGFQPFTIRVTVPAGERVGVQANLVALPAAEAPHAVQAPISEAPPPREGGAGPLPWVLFGVAGATAIGGGIFGAIALGKRDEANDAAATDRRAYDQARDASKRSALVADIAFGVTVAAAVTGIILLATSGGSESEGDRAAGPVVAPIVLQGGAGLSLAGSL